ncbi:2-dehydropantoate 2-reductase [Fusarium keratoplasticum]|uniref:2-dehydropantoate 2-reductase n=1 Tax=Fusarium keratoplasticum TaxID=1328300 RepID=A0ACC0QKH4_9HYPO|nr:2-dehydropantoate 2-reductase [Fusarium keratoplasticum]KAI8654742.1 2-dehydropantoate 2-reductase [Fusarium keratoplasticum]KAI8655593.1 2-dehydropantoate 2-reductase [Fusarium keratoplasticum]
MAPSYTDMSVLIYGTGSIGAIFAYVISKSIPEKNIYAICRSNYDAAKEQGFTIDSDLWGTGLSVRPCIVRSVGEAVESSPQQFRWLLVTTKATIDCPDAEAIKPAVSPNTTIVILQNGIAIEEPFRAAFPQTPILSGVLYTPVSQTGPTTFTHGTLDEVFLGTFPAAAPVLHMNACAKFTCLVRTGGAKAHHITDIQIERWKKLLINGSENPICALCRLRDAEFFRSSCGATAFMRDVMSEIAATARAAGYTAIDEGVVQEQLELLTIRPLPGVMPSMMADALAGRQMEVDVILGNTVKIAREHRVATPLLKALLALTTALNKSITAAS